MTTSYDLTQLDSHSFEHMVNFLAMKKLGNGITGFAAGPDGGRDGYLKGKAPYPTTEECWEGIWYIQSKYHKPNLSTDSQKWLIREVVKEIKSYSHSSQRIIPDIWIIATNIEPSGQSQTGAYDKIISLVKKYAPKIKVDIWGGRKILDFLMEYPMAAQAYGHFLTPGHIISALYKNLEKEDGKRKSLIEHFMVSQFKDLSYTKLEQAGSNNDHKPKIHELFRDLPIIANSYESECFILQSLVSSSSNVQKISTWLNYGEEWKDWTKNPKRTRVILLKGGPGQGKSTVGQYFSQIQRAAYILSAAQPTTTPIVRDIARDLKTFAEKDGFWPSIPRIPIFIELKDYANWYISKDKFSPRNIIEYICHKVNMRTSFVIDSFDLGTVFSQSTWFINFDGLDEVPNDLKDDIANEVISFSNEFLPSLDSDALILCSTRPQGYSGQFDELDASVCHLTPLPKEIALSCAEPVVRFGRSEEDGDNSLKILEAAMMSPQVKEIMTTPLQSHIMAVVVRDGGKPPEKRWELFNNFYTVMKKREILKNFADANIKSLLQEKDLLLKAIHDRLGICLHVRAEYSPGAEASLPKEEFRKLATSTTEILMDGNIEETVVTLMEATTERLVFVNTPDSTDYVRFDIRQLQEFFAAEFIHNDVSDQILIERLSVIIGDAHWREVVHFVLSALIHYKKKTALMLVAKMLQKLDIDDDNHKLKFYKRKSAVGALLVLRLVEEGMLEQDKRVRALFSECLMPLWINTEQNIISRIIKLQMNQSKNWILYNMIESFISMDYIETVSCPLLFSCMIDTSHERFGEIYTRLSSMPDECLAVSFLTYNMEYHHHYFGDLIKPWFIEFAVTKYFAKESSQTLLSGIYFFLSRYLSIGKNKVQLLNVDEKYKEYLYEFFIKPDSASHEEMADASNYCFITPVSFDLDWKNCDSLPLSASNFNDKVYSFPIELFKALDSYFTEKNASSFRRILNLIIENEYKLSCTPSTLQAFIPLCFDNSIFQCQVNALYNGDDDYLNAYLSNMIFEGKPISPDSKYVVFNHDPFSGEKWKALCSDLPDLALNVISAQFVDRAFEGDIITTESENIYTPILTIAKKYPNVFSSYYFLWDGVFNSFPSEASHLKKLMISNELPVRYKSTFNIKLMSIYKLNLPDDKPLIVHLANTLASSKSQLDKFKKERPEYFTDGVLEAFGLTFEILYKIASNTEEDYLLRISSLSLLLHHQLNDKATTIDNFFGYSLDDLCIKLYRELYAQLISIPIVTLLHDVINIDVRLQEFVGRYSLISRNNFPSLTSMQLIISNWRERSASVVHNCGKLEQWLTEESV